MTKASTAINSGPSEGRVVAIRGNIVDVRFEPPPPPGYRALRTGNEGAVVLEVEIHITPETVRCIALTATRGLWRGAQVLDTGGMIEGAIVRTMKALAAVSIRQYEQAVLSLGDYYRTVELGLRVALRDLPPPSHSSHHKSTQIAAVVFGSDYGLCGRFNEEIADYARERSQGTNLSARKNRTLCGYDRNPAWRLPPIHREPLHVSKRPLRSSEEVSALQVRGGLCDQQSRPYSTTTVVVTRVSARLFAEGDCA